jgi:hypothetical protein
MKKAIMHICRTGEKEQFYTLYIEGIVVNGATRAHYCQFMQNLAHTQADAEAKAEELKERMTWWDEVLVEVHDSPRPIYTHFTTYCDIEMKMSKSRKVWWGAINEAFWILWKCDKADLKKEGYWIKRTDDGDWLLFKRVQAEEIEWRFD